MFYGFGSVKSFNQINYSSEEKSSLIAMAEESDIFPSNSGQYDFSLFWTHGSSEFNSVKNKFCKGIKDHDKYAKAFLYSHRNSFNPQNTKQRRFLDKTSNGCISQKSKLKILKSFERKNSRGLEMDNRIDNGGSGVYGYLVEID